MAVTGGSNNSSNAHCIRKNTVIFRHIQHNGSASGRHFGSFLDIISRWCVCNMQDMHSNGFTAFIPQIFVSFVFVSILLCILKQKQFSAKTDFTTMERSRRLTSVSHSLPLCLSVGRTDGSCVCVCFAFTIFNWTLSLSPLAPSACRWCHACIPAHYVHINSCNGNDSTRATAQLTAIAVALLLILLQYIFFLLYFTSLFGLFQYI